MRIGFPKFLYGGRIGWQSEMGILRMKNAQCITHNIMNNENKMEDINIFQISLIGYLDKNFGKCRYEKTMSNPKFGTDFDT